MAVLFDKFFVVIAVGASLLLVSLAACVYDPGYYGPQPVYGAPTPIAPAYQTYAEPSAYYEYPAYGLFYEQPPFVQEGSVYYGRADYRGHSRPNNRGDWNRNNHGQAYDGDAQHGANGAHVGNAPHSTHAGGSHAGGRDQDGDRSGPGGPH